MPTKKAGKSKAKVEESKSGILKFGESYTSLILGIIVVIISTVLLLSFVHNKNVNRTNMTKQQVANNQPTVTPTPNVTVTSTPTTSVVTPTGTTAPTLTKKVEVKKVSPTVTPKQEKAATGSTYTIAQGDSLWSISEKVYDSGYNWVDIARANNLDNPGMLHVGNKLKLPKVESKISTVSKDTAKKADVTEKNITVSNKITGSTYKIVHGDDLWDIAVRAYGDGYRWVDIARANNLDNPGLIHVNNTLKIPRGK